MNKNKTWFFSVFAFALLLFTIGSASAYTCVTLLNDRTYTPVNTDYCFTNGIVGVLNLTFENYTSPNNNVYNITNTSSISVRNASVGNTTIHLWNQNETIAITGGPNVTNVLVSPSTVYFDTHITCIGTFTNNMPESGSTFKWYQNGASVGYTTQTVSSTIFSVGDSVKCQYTPNNAVVTGVPFNSTAVTVQDKAGCNATFDFILQAVIYVLAFVLIGILFNGWVVQNVTTQSVVAFISSTIVIVGIIVPVAIQLVASTCAP